MTERRTVLIIDESPESLAVLRGLLEDSYHIQVARRGAQALKLASASPPPDVILLSVPLPEMDSLGLLTDLRYAIRTREIPVIVMAARDEQEAVDAARNTGVKAVVNRPLDPDAVLAAVKDCCPAPAIESPAQDQQDQNNRSFAVSKTHLNTVNRLSQVVIVDDEELNLAILEQQLASLHCKVQVFTQAQPALDWIELHGADLALLDVVMPGIDGLEMLVRIRQTLSMAELPVIMATSLDTSADMVEAFTLGANDYVTKPFDLPVVLARVRTQLSLRAAREENDALHHRIAELTSVGPQSAEGMEAWALKTAPEVAAVAGLRALEIWHKQGEELSALTTVSTAAPTASLLESLARDGRVELGPGELALALRGFSGTVRGALICLGGHIRPRSAESQLLESFARQLGGAIELSEVQRELSEERKKRQQARESMLERGISLLQICPVCGRCFEHDQKACPDDDAALSFLQLIPILIAERYRLERLVGEGGMGLVFKAHDERLSRQVALKVIKAEYYQADLMRQRFAREAKAVARIKHPGVVSVFDYGELEDRSMFIVMELLGGYPLDEMVAAHGPGTPSQVALIMRQIGGGLSAAHDAGLIHRDIKPGNIFLVGEGDTLSAKLLDFGVAKELDADVGITRTGMIVGTPRYMAPEQALGTSASFGSDLYAFASSSFYALTGNDVLDAVTLAQILGAFLKKTPAPPLSRYLPDVPAPVEEAFRQALDMNPDARPKEVRAWVEGFVDALETMPATAGGWVADDAQLKTIAPVSPSDSLVLEAAAATKSLRPKSIDP